MKFSFDHGSEGEDENKVLIAPLRQNQFSGLALFGLHRCGPAPEFNRTSLISKLPFYFIFNNFILI